MVASDRIAPTSRSVVVSHDVVPVDQWVQLGEVQGGDYVRVRRGRKGQYSAGSQVVSEFLDLGDEVTGIVIRGSDVVSAVFGSRKTRVFDVNVESKH